MYIIAIKPGLFLLLFKCKSKKNYIMYKLKHIFFYFLIILTFSSCFKGKNADLVIHNAVIHTMKDGDKTFEAIAIKDGKILEVGPERQILNKYSADEKIDAEGKHLYPGFTDAHGHILSLAKQNLSLDLVGVPSFSSLMVRMEKYHSKSGKDFIIGRGWDQSLWESNELPNNKLINEKYSDIPVFLERIDGHAALVNDYLLKLAGITKDTKIDGGLVILSNDSLTGLLLDNAIELVKLKLPKFTDGEIKQEILKVQNNLFSYGITGVHEAGIERKDIDLFESLVNNGKLKLNLYAMLMPSDNNIAFAKSKGIYENKNLKIGSFKVYADGALGSRGALLKKPYSDMENHFGLLLSSPEQMESIAKICEQTGYQMNTHAIGDSANYSLLQLYRSVFEKNPDHRWRIEHAQVIDPADFSLFGRYGVFPSVQPTHAVSDQRWAEDRLGKERLVGAYAYKSLLEQFGMVAFGTDFPVENINPFLTIHAAVFRKNKENEPTNGFLMKEAMSLEDCLKAMTIWPAFASFQENSLGSLEKGKDATFIILNKPIAEDGIFHENFANYTFIKGELVYTTEK